VLRLATLCCQCCIIQGSAAQLLREQCLVPTQMLMQLSAALITVQYIVGLNSLEKGTCMRPTRGAWA